MRVQLLAVMKKEFRQTFRDRRMAAMLILAPIIQLTLLGYAVDLEVDNVPTGICDLDRSALSRRLIDGLLADHTLKRELETTDPLAALADGRVQVMIVVPRGFAAAITNGRATQIQVLFDGSNPIRAPVAMNTAVEYLQHWALARAQDDLARLAALQGQVLSVPQIKVEPRIFYNPRLKSPIYMVPGVAAMVLIIVTTIVTAMGFAREREMGTIEQLLVTPIRPLALFLGKTLPFALIGLVVTGMILAIGTNLFHVPVRGSLTALLVGTLFYLMTLLGMGVFIATITRTQQQAILGGFFFIMPAILLSGFMSPIESMPGWIQPITYLNPVRYFVEMLRSCLLKGAGFSDMWLQLGALAVFAVFILGISSIRFQGRL